MERKEVCSSIRIRDQRARIEAQRIKVYQRFSQIHVYSKKARAVAAIVDLARVTLSTVNVAVVLCSIIS